MKLSKGIWLRLLIVALLAALAAFPLIGCTGSKGDSGSKGKAGTSKGTLAGTVTNNITNSPVSDVSVALDPDLGMTITTDNSGNYSASLPAGNYTVTYSKSGFTSQSKSFSILAGVTSDGDVALVPTANVIVDAGADTSADPDGSVSPTANVDVMDGSTCTTYSWVQTEGAEASILNGTTATPIITLTSMEDYKTALYTHLEDLNRTMVQGLNHLAVEEGNIATFEVTVTCGGTDYTDTINVEASTPWLPNPGIRTVAKEVPVLLHGRDMGDSTWTWTMDSKPGSSAADFDDASSRNPVFTPDVVGHYQVSVTNGTDTDTLDIYAGTWEGILGTADVGISSECAGCHAAGTTGNAGVVANTIGEWLESGHSEIMSQNLDTDGGHWSLSCAGCHTVGYNTDADNNGFDEAAASEGWTPPAHGEEGTWEAMLADTSLKETVQRSNIQCENCHGPNTGTTLHNTGTLMDSARASLSADVCGSCHGEPARHARYQQWAESGHGDTNFATDESVDGSTGYARSCSPCHSGNGFVAWGETSDPYGPDMDDEVIDIVNASADDQGIALEYIIVSQTCQACHDPHDPGNMSGEPNNAKVRVSGTTPETKGGFIAANVGRGAVCMMCHNSRRGGYNTTLHPDYFDGNMEMIDETPHHGPQSDVLMGENGFFVDTGDRSPHSYIVDTCTTCHMELTPPPAQYSYNLAGTNHTFEASLTICSECHGTFDGGTLQASTATLLGTLETGLTNSLIGEINQIAADVAAGPGSGHPASGVLIDYDSDTLTAADLVNTTDMVTAITTSSRGRFNITVASHSAVSGVNLSDIVVWVDSDDSGDIQANEIFTGDTDGEGIVDSCIGVGTPYGSVPDASTCTGDGGVATNGQTIAKANWNFVLITEDGSMGIHNPGFVHDVLLNTISALNAL